MGRWDDPTKSMHIVFFVGKLDHYLNPDDKAGYTASTSRGRVVRVGFLHLLN